MPLSATTVWEVRTTGNDTNGGAYSSGGTDWSQQDSPQYSVTDGVTAGTTTITSATAAFGTDVVGNVMYVQGGTGAVVADWYQIISRTNATTIVVDRLTGLTAGTGVTFRIGGALASPAIVAGKAVFYNTIHIKSGTYTCTNTTGNIANSIIKLVASFTYWIGYGATRGDNGTKPVISAGVLTSCTLIASGSGQHCTFENIECNGENRTSLRGFSFGSGSIAVRCHARQCTNNGYNSIAGCVHCSATECSTQPAFIGTNFTACESYANSVTGFETNAQGVMTNCISRSNTGGTSHGFNMTNVANQMAVNCTSYANGGNGFNMVGNNSGLINCLSVNSSGWGFSHTGSPLRLAHCAGHNNTSGNVTAPTATHYNLNFVTLTADPFVNAGSGNFALNNTAGGGAALRALALPATFPAGLTAHYLDIGAAQHQDSGSGGGIMAGRNWTGGYNG